MIIDLSIVKFNEKKTLAIPHYNRIKVEKYSEFPQNS